MKTIDSQIMETCFKQGSKNALEQKIGKTWQPRSYSDLWRKSELITSGLQRSGIKKGDRVALLASPSPDWVMAYLGILKSDAIVVPVDKDLRSGELRHILDDCNARVIFTEEFYLDTIASLTPDLPDLEKIIIMRPEKASEEMDSTLESLLEKKRLVYAADFSCEEKPSPPNHEPQDPAVIIYTSGTTGRSKGAVLSHANIMSNIYSAMQLYDINPRIHMLSILPIHHIFEQVIGILLPLSTGGTISFVESLKKIGANLEELKPNFLLGVPAIFRIFHNRISKGLSENFFSKILFSLPGTKRLIQNRIRSSMGGNQAIFISGGAALDPEVAAGLRRFGLKIYQGYGITETSPVIAVETSSAQRLGSVGKVFPGVEVNIHNPDHEGVGEILVKGPNVMIGYFNDPKTTSEVLKDGWYHTGDLGRLDQDGYLFVSGRMKNLIVTPNGKNVYPEEVENELLKSDFIAEVMVYGHKVDNTAEEVYAQIYPDQDSIDKIATTREKTKFSIEDVEKLIRDEVQKRCKNLANFKRVKKFSLREDEFPKTTTRKIKRFAVEADIPASE